MTGSLERIELGHPRDMAVGAGTDGGMGGAQLALWETEEATPWRLLALLTGIAIIARAIGLDGGLWIDEIYSLIRSFRQPLGTILTEFWGDNHHPLYALLAHASRAAFGESAWSIRLPALLFGVAAVPALFALGRLVLSRREALLASALLAVSYHHVWFSQNARGYSAIACFAIVLMWALMRGLATGRTVYFVWYGLAAGLGAYTHLTMIFVVAGHAVGAVAYLVLPGRPIDRRTAIRGGCIAFGLGAFVTLVLYAPMLRDVVRYFLHTPSGLRGVSTPQWAVLEGIRVLVLGLSGGVAMVGALVVAGGAFVAVSGVASLWRRNRLFVLLLATPVVVTLAGAAATRGTLYPRFFFFAIGPGIVLAVRGAFAVAEWGAARLQRPALLGAQLATTAVSAVIAVSALSLGFDYRYPKQDFEGAMRYVVSQRTGTDRVVSTGVPADPYRTMFGQSWPNVGSLAELDSVRALGTRTWVLYTFPRYIASRSPDLWAVLRDECPAPRVFHRTVGGGDVMACALNPK